MKFPRTSRYHSCLICGTEKSKCGWKADNPDFLFCMSIHDAINVPPGWKYIGDTRGGQWGMFIPDTGREYTPEERAEYFQRQQQIKLNQRTTHAKSLSESERHHEHGKLIENLTLHSHHRDDLKRRGLSDELIAKGKFRSIDKFQRLDFEVSHNLAGVDISGRSLTNYSAGYIVPIWNEQFQIIGYQIRNDANGEDTAKYMWATSKPNLRRRKGASSHLQNGELPLTFSVPAWFSDTNDTPSQNQAFSLEINPSKKLTGCINLSEGMLKAWIIAQLRQLLVIGAAGGNFTASPEILKRYLEAASALLGGTKFVVLWADAGAIANKQVMLQYRRTYQLLKKWGYTLQVAWWGQIDKKCLDGDEYLDEYELLTWQQFEGMSHHPNRFWDSVKQELGRIKKCLRRTPQTPTLLPESPKKENKLEYVPGFLPSYGEYVEKGCPKIIYKNDERGTIWKEAVLKGWSFTVDMSVPGVGKSHSAGMLTADYMGMGQLMYLASDHRNPTTSTIENNFVDVPPRFYEMVLDKTRLTPNNKPFRVHPTSNINSEDIIKGNCSRADVFGEARRKNLDLESSQNVICQGCLLRKLCTGSVGDSGDYYGYLSERIEALKKPQVRLHPDSTPLPENYNYDKVGGIWDELSKLMRSTKKIEVHVSDFLHTVGQYAMAHSSFGDYPSNSPLTVAYKVLHELFNLEQSELPRYGLSNNDILSKLGFAPNTVGEVIREIVENLSPDLDFLTESSDAIDTSNLSGSDKKGTGKLNKLLRGEHNQETIKKLKSLPLNWLVPMLEVWAGYVAGGFTFNNGVFTIHQFDSRHRDLARAFAFNIFLDATISLDILSLKLGVPREHILVIETETPDYSNLEIIHIVGMGNLGRDRRPSQQVRVDALRSAVVKLEEGKGNPADLVRVIERKAFAREGDGYHFRDSRGINRFSSTKALIGIGAPYANIGDMSAEYSLLMKDKFMRTKVSGSTTRFMFNLVRHLPTENVDLLISSNGLSLQEFIDSEVRAEIQQEIGRLRSHLRKGESLTYYFVGDYDLLAVLASLPGVKYTRQQAREVSPMCAAGEERTKLMVMTAIGNLLSRGLIAPKQREVEAELVANSPIGKVKQERISQLMKHFGGWRAAVELIRNTLAAVASRGCKPSTDNCFEDEQWIIQTYLPLIAQTAVSDPVQAVRELVDIAIVHGWAKFKEFLVQVEYGLQQQLVELVLEMYALVDMQGLEELTADGG